MSLNLWVIKRDGTPIRKIKARPGLKTTRGVITRISEKSIWVRRSDGEICCVRSYDGRLPSIYQSYAPAD